MKYVSTQKALDFPEDYITAGYLYLVKTYDEEGFHITNDNGDLIYCLWKGCAHINGDWEVHDLPG